MAAHGINMERALDDMGLWPASMSSQVLVLYLVFDCKNRENGEDFAYRHVLASRSVADDWTWHGAPRCILENHKKVEDS